MDEFPATWIHGSPDCNANTDPLIQVHRFDAGTFILRQNMCVNFEAPFLYLLFGNDKALLLDTGATQSEDAFPLRNTVDEIINTWLMDNGQDEIELVVAHSHGHGDHFAADGQFAGRTKTTIIPTGFDAVRDFFGLSEWPRGVAEFTLGGRTLNVIPIPGHFDDHVAVYDITTGILLTGDTLYPGRLYVRDWPNYKASIGRLVTFAEQHQHSIEHILGAHIEMTNDPGTEFSVGTHFHPNEHVLQLTAEHLTELHRSLMQLGDTPTRKVHDDFIIFPLPED